jgi:hypothetical protein
LLLLKKSKPANIRECKKNELGWCLNFYVHSLEEKELTFKCFEGSMMRAERLIKACYCPSLVVLSARTVEPETGWLGL